MVIRLICHDDCTWRPLFRPFSFHVPREKVIWYIRIINNKVEEEKEKNQNTDKIDDACSSLSYFTIIFKKFFFLL